MVVLVVEAEPSHNPAGTTKRHSISEMVMPRPIQLKTMAFELEPRSSILNIN